MTFPPIFSWLLFFGIGSAGVVIGLALAKTASKTDCEDEFDYSQLHDAAWHDYDDKATP